MSGQNLQKFNLSAGSRGAKIREGPQDPSYATAWYCGKILFNFRLKIPEIVSSVFRSRRSVLALSILIKC